MSEIAVALGIAAPYYNLAFVVIVIYLFIQLFKTETKKHYIKPWKFVFLAVCVFIVEEVTTVLRAAGVISIPRHINGFFELAIIILFLYMLLLQKEFLVKSFKTKKRSKKA